MDSEHSNLLELLEAALPVSIRHVVHRMRDVGRNLDMRTALVGGVPRDLLRVKYNQLNDEQLYGSVRDFDVVVEQDAATYAHELVRRLPGKLVVNEAFGTATLTTSDPVVIDIATARTESYEMPGSLPEVSAVGVELAQDMARRDFSINAMAVDVSNQVGELIDPMGGSGDIRDRVVRVLHPASFSDDPTRLMRAIRYSIRLEYDLEPTTHRLFQAAIEEAVADHLSPERIRYELECIGTEERWAEIWAVMDLAGLLTSLAPGLGALSRGWELKDAKAVDVAINYKQELLQREEIEPWLLHTAWALAAVSIDHLENACERLGLFKRHQRWILGAREVLHLVVPRLREEMPASDVSQLLEKHARPAVALAIFLFQPDTEKGVAARKRLLAYLEKYSGVRSELSGDDLVKLGFKPGPLLGRVRDQLRYLRLDGVINDVEAEMEYAKKFLAPQPLPEGEGQE